MVAALQQLVVQVQGLSGSVADLSSLHATLKSPQVEQALRQNSGAILEAAQALHPAAHSLGLLYLL